MNVVSGSSYLIVATGRSGERLALTSTGLALHHQRQHRHAMTTTDAFHRYRVVLRGPALQVFVDDVLRLAVPAALAPRPGYPRAELAFGASNSPEIGEALWSEVKFRAPHATQPLRDVVLRVSEAGR